ncbi:hypothetical protein J6590_001295 [Homalodisca vitripennis]|nr:hypothetical protein J6590_001295 [Homalodisca vitripennis]
MPNMSADRSVICCRIQELDGGFFERFGSLLKEQQTNAEAADVAEDDVEDEVVEEEIKKETPANLLAEAVGLNPTHDVIAANSARHTSWGIGDIWQEPTPSNTPVLWYYE